MPWMRWPHGLEPSRRRAVHPGLALRPLRRVRVLGDQRRGLQVALPRVLCGRLRRVRRRPGAARGVARQGGAPRAAAPGRGRPGGVGGGRALRRAEAARARRLPAVAGRRRPQCLGRAARSGRRPQLSRPGQPPAARPGDLGAAGASPAAGGRQMIMNQQGRSGVSTRLEPQPPQAVFLNLFCRCDRLCL